MLNRAPPLRAAGIRIQRDRALFAAATSHIRRILDVEVSSAATLK